MANPAEWKVTTNGQKGDIKLDYIAFSSPPKGSPVSSVPAGLYQIIFFRSLGSNLINTGALEVKYISIENEGPGDMKIWADKGKNPELAGIAPDIVLGIKQSVTVLVSDIVLVRPTGKSINGNYVISWCCGIIAGGPTVQ